MLLIVQSLPLWLARTCCFQYRTTLAHILTCATNHRYGLHCGVQAPALAHYVKGLVLVQDAMALAPAHYVKGLVLVHGVDQVLDEIAAAAASSWGDR